MHTQALCRKIICYLTIRWALGEVQNSVQCAAAIIFAIFPVTWKHGNWRQVPSQWCWQGRAGAQHPRATRKAKLKTPCFEILTSCNFWNQARWRDLDLISPVDHIFEALLQLAMGTEKTVVPPMPPVIIPMMYVAELVPGKVKLLSKLFEKRKAVLFLPFRVVRTDFHD